MSDTANSPGPFDRAFAITVGHEGTALDTTYSDRGNWTGGAVGQGKLVGSKFGISAAAYPTLDIANLTQADAEAIYRRDYWAKIRGDDLPLPVAILAFDAAVNSGVPTASRWLQAACGVTEDSIVGDQTVAACNALPVQAVLIEMLAQRINFDGRNPRWLVDGLGWSRRLAALPFEIMRA